MVSDGFANFPAPLWYTVKTLFHLADSDIGLLTLFFSLTTNFGQPLFGYVIDRWRLRNIIPLALGLSAGFMCMLGFAPSLWVFILCLMFGGLGIALFHPRGGALAAEASGARRAFGMSIFGAGGAIGCMLTSLGAPLLHALGLKLGMKPLQGLIFALPLGLMAAVLLWRYNPQGPSPAADAPREHFSLRRHLLPYLGPLAPLFTVMVLRSATAVSYGTFIQILQGNLGHSSLFQGTVLFIFLAGAASGGLIGSRLSEHYGRRFITVVSLLLAPPLLYYALSAPPGMVMVLLFFAGFTLRGAESVNIAQTQDLLPQGMSTASAISMGFTWGVAGLVPFGVGLVSKATGNLAYALAITTTLPLIAALVALKLPTNAPPAALANSEPPH